MKSQILVALLLLSGLSTSCLRLDDNLFNPDNTISRYLFDDYPGKVDFKLDAAYAIPPNLVSLIPLTSDDGGSQAGIQAVYIGDPARISADTVILYLHGNRDHLDFYWQRAKLLANVGGKNRYGVMMIDYRGYGLSEGSSTESSLYADAEAALAWLKTQGLTGNRLIVYGFSMGTIPATELTANPRSLTPAKLILEAPMASSEAMVQGSSVLALPASFFTNLKIDNAGKMRRVNQPFMWLHGTEDDFLSLKDQGEIVFRNYQGIYKEAHRIAGANHGDIPLVMGFDNYRKKVLQFIRRP